ncbi:DUF87 domain-containing protein [Brevibacillus centrosporus]|uniref:VirB4 family type IV secretion system protein n=1 Tax=Brevibacillus centrosporus TaxID=54910 RepID=UPI00116AC68F|nr:DUF87 domain-containing protein [Brevibacillus centrosporus]MEC2133322.1 DUF87 domain-containing protein [Brevibacillus centrosporus]GED33922.1 hypothetical protein BCE02nite_50630 [Brevibacillus centrosporus]
MLKNLFKWRKKETITEEDEMYADDLLHQNEEEIKDLFANGASNLWSIVLPDGADLTARDIGYLQDKIGKERVLQPLYVTQGGWPRKIKTAAFHQLINAPDTDVMFYLQKSKRKDAIKSLQKKATILKSNLRLETKRGNEDQVFDLQTKIHDTEMLQQEIAIGLNDQFLVSVIANVYADNEDDLEALTQDLSDNMAGDGFNLRTTYSRIKMGYVSGLPLGRNQIRESWRNLDRYAAASVFPFATNDLKYAGLHSIPWGKNKITDNYVFFDNFSRANRNYNLGIFGVSGAGKSFAVKLLAARGLIDDIATVFIDPEGEYRDMVLQLGGVYISLVEERLSEKPPITINPCAMWPTEIELDGEEDDELDHIDHDKCEVYKDDEGRTFIRFVNINEKMNEIIDFFEMIVKTKIKPGLNAFEREFLEDAIVKVFKKRGFNQHPDSLYEDGHMDGSGMIHTGRVRKQEITITDIYNQLEGDFGNREEAKELLSSIRPFLRSRKSRDYETEEDVSIRGSMSMFDGQSYFGEGITAALEDQMLVGFDLSALESNDRLLQIAYHVIFNWCWEKFVKGNPIRKKRLLCDEAWKMVDNEQAVNFLEKAARRARKRNCSLTIASQDFQRLAESSKARGVVSNCHTVFFMKQDDLGRDLVRDTFQLTEGEISLISGDLPPGEGILRVGQESVWMRTEASQDELPFLESNLAVQQAMKRSAS